jgi:hypothetical protein
VTSGATVGFPVDADADAYVEQSIAGARSNLVSDAYGLPSDRCKVFPRNLAFGLYFLQHLQMRARPGKPQAAGWFYGSPVSIGRLGLDSLTLVLPWLNFLACRQR